MRKNKHHPLFLTFYIVMTITAIISVFCHITYQQMTSRLRNIAIAESEQYLSQSAETISTSFNNSLELLKDPITINSFSNILSSDMQKPSTLHGVLRSLSTELRRLFHSDNYIQDVGLFISDGQKDYWCSTKMVSHDFQLDYELGLYSFEDLPYDRYRDMILTSTNNYLVHKDFFVGHVTSNYSNPYSCQIIHLVFPVKTNRENLHAYAIMQLNLDGIQDMLTSFQYSGAYFSLYTNNSLLYTTDDRIDIFENSETDYVKAFIDGLTLTCCVSLDSAKIYEGIAPFSNLLHILFFILIITILFFVCFVFLYWLIPITKVAASIPGTNGREHTIRKINRHLVELSNQTEETKHKLLEYKKNRTLQDVYLGKTNPCQDNLPLTDLEPFQENNYRCICIGSLTERPNQQFDIDSMIEQIKACSIAASAYTVIDDLLFCLIPQSDQSLYANSEVFFSLLNQLLASLNPNNDQQYAIGISDIYNDISGIPSAYQEARKSWQNALLWQNASVVFNTSLTQYASRYSVDYTMLEAMYQAIITNHQDTALDIFDQLVANNFNNEKEGKQRALYCQQFTADILGVLVRISTEYDIHTILESYLSQNTQLSLNKRIDMLRQAIVESCEFIPIHEYDRELINAIFEYCEAHYSDYQLSLSLLADQFHLSKSSISKYFKANSGINFSSYIEKLRIQQAEKLILENKLSVREIAEKIGYQNITTFYNAFRKVKKCTPTEWRQRQLTR